MPIKLIPPRKGKTPYWSGKGTYLGKYVDRSTKARKRAVAVKILQKWEREVERGEFSEPDEATFASAAAAYMKAGGERIYVRRLLDYFGDAPLSHINQAAIDGAALGLYPQGSAATRNRSIYTPVSAILRHAGNGFGLRRPKGYCRQSSDSVALAHSSMSIFPTILDGKKNRHAQAAIPEPQKKKGPSRSRGQV